MKSIYYSNNNRTLEQFRVKKEVVAKGIFIYKV